MGDDAQQVQGVGVVGLGAEDRAVPPGCLGQEAALVLLQAEDKVVVHGSALRIEKDEGRRMKDEPDSSFILHPSSFQVMVSVSTAEVLNTKSVSPL
jgi:hypothetical protein